MRKVFFVLLLALSVNVSADQGTRYTFDRMVVFSNHGTFDSAEGEIQLTNGSAQLVNNRFYVFGNMCVFGVCMPMFEELFILNQNGNFIDTFNGIEHKRVTLVSSNPLIVAFPSRKGGSYHYHFSHAQKIDADARRLGRLYLDNATVNGDTAIAIINNTFDNQ